MMAYVEVYCSPHGEATWMLKERHGPGPNWRIRDTHPGEAMMQVDWTSEQDRRAVHQVSNLEWLRRHNDIRPHL